MCYFFNVSSQHNTALKTALVILSCSIKQVKTKLRPANHIKNALIMLNFRFFSFCNIVQQNVAEPKQHPIILSTIKTKNGNKNRLAIFFKKTRYFDLVLLCFGFITLNFSTKARKYFQNQNVLYYKSLTARQDVQHFILATQLLVLAQTVEFE